MTEPNAKDLFPNVGGRPEILTVFDLRQDKDPAERILAKSIQGLFNSTPVNHDKIYLILTDEDANLLDWLVKQQFVLSAGFPKTMDDLMLRWPSRDAVAADAVSLNAATGVAGCERWMIVTDPRLIQKYHLNVREKLSGRWTSEADADQWLLDKYGDKLNMRVLAMPSGTEDLSLMDYGIANKAFTFKLGDSSDPLAEELRTNFDSNVPCLTSQTSDMAAQASTTKRLSENGKFVVPLNGLSNLSVWTTFHPFDREDTDVYWGTINNPRRLVADDLGKMRFDVKPYEHGDFSAHDLLWLRDLASPLFESTFIEKYLEPEERYGYRIGVIDESSYGAAFGADRDRIWNGYLRLCRETFDLILN